MAEPVPARRGPAPATIALILAAVLAAAALAYALFFRVGEETPPDNQVEAAAPSADAMIAELSQRLRADPDNHEGWYLLGMALRDSERFGEAAQAFRRAMELQPRNADYAGYLGEALLLAGAGTPPPEAERLFRRTLELQPGNPQALYYLATLKDMGGDHRGALDDLIALLRTAPAGAPWAPQVREAASAIASQNNIEIAGRLPAAPPPTTSTATAAIPGPTPQQMAAASSMRPAEQAQASRGMVDRLAARLRANPRDEARWIMMMRSRMVLNEPQAARDALRSALAAFANDAAVQGRLRQAARELAVPTA